MMRINHNNLTFMLANDISDYRGDSYGLIHSFQGMVKRLITSITGSPATIQAMQNNEILISFSRCYSQLSRKYGSFSGPITKIGLNTNACVILVEKS